MINADNYCYHIILVFGVTLIYFEQGKNTMSHIVLSIVKIIKNTLKRITFLKTRTTIFLRTFALSMPVTPRFVKEVNHSIIKYTAFNNPTQGLDQLASLYPCVLMYNKIKGTDLSLNLSLR